MVRDHYRPPLRTVQRTVLLYLGLALGQAKVEEKSNEITAIPKLLQLLELSGCIVTIDAMGCQKEIAREIVEAQADYLLAVKENQGQLHEDVRDLFQGAEEFDFEGVLYDFARTVNKNHGRIETRQCWVITDPDCLDYLQTRQQWADLNVVVKVTARGRRLRGQVSNPATTSAAWPAKPRACWRPPADIGASKTACTGPWTLPLEKITAVSARTMVPKTWLSCAR